MAVPKSEDFIGLPEPHTGHEDVLPPSQALAPACACSVWDPWNQWRVLMRAEADRRINPVAEISVSVSVAGKSK